MLYDPNDPNKLKASQQLRAEQAAGQKKGSGFTGAGRIMQANVGGRLGQQVAGRIGQAGQQAQQQIGQASQKFQTQLGQTQAQQAGAQQTAGTAVQSVVSPTPAPQQQATAPVSGAVQPPIGAIAPQFDPATVGAFQQATSGEYTGPTGLEDLGDLQSQAYSAQQMGEAGETMGGRMELLQRMYGRGSRQYSASQAALDAMLLGKSAKELAAAKKETAGISEQLETEQEIAEAQARQAGLETKRSAAEMLQKVGATEAQELGKIKAQKQDYEKKIGDLSRKVQDEIKSGQLSKETLDVVKKLGIDEKSQFYGMPLEEIANKIATTSPAQLSEAAFANKEQVHKLNALRRLSGQEDVFSQADVERTGTMRDPTAGFQFKGDLGTILQKQKESFEGLAGGVMSKKERDAYNMLNQKGINGGINGAFERARSGQASAEDTIAIDKYQKATGFSSSSGRSIMSRLASGNLYDKNTGKLNEPFVTEIKNDLKKLKKGSVGTKEYKAAQSKIKALEQLLSRYNSGSSFKLKE